MTEYTCAHCDKQATHAEEHGALTELVCDAHCIRREGETCPEGPEPPAIHAPPSPQPTSDQVHDAVERRLGNLAMSVFFALKRPPRRGDATVGFVAWERRFDSHRQYGTHRVIRSGPGLSIIFGRYNLPSEDSALADAEQRRDDAHDPFETGDIGP